MNIQVFKTDKDATEYILTCTAAPTCKLKTAEFYKKYPDTGTEPLYTYEFPETPADPTYHITQEMLDDAGSGIVIRTDFVYMKVTEQDVNPPFEENSLLMCTFYPGDIINQLMECIDSIPADDGNKCSNINSYNNLYMRFKAVALSLRTGDYITAQKYFDKFFSTKSVKPKAHGGCHCHA